MHELLSSSINRIKQSDNIKRLLANEQLVVSIQCEEEQWYIIFSDTEIQIRSFHSEIENGISIEGSIEAMRLLLNGEDFLLSMQKRGELKVQGDLKSLLLLESIFYLGKISAM